MYVVYNFFMDFSFLAFHTNFIHKFSNEALKNVRYNLKRKEKWSMQEMQLNCAARAQLLFVLKRENITRFCIQIRGSMWLCVCGCVCKHFVVFDTVNSGGELVNQSKHQ